MFRCRITTYITPYGKRRFGVNNLMKKFLEQKPENEKTSSSPSKKMN